MELSKQTLEDVFRITRQVGGGNITLTKGTTDLVRAHGFNPNSATMTIRSLCHMLRGERYRRALTIDATDYFLSRIKEEDGTEGLRVALLSSREYMRQKGHRRMSAQGLVDSGFQKAAR